MRKPALSDPIVGLVREHVDSFEKLELLKSLRANPDQSWSPDTVSHRLNLSSRIASEALEALSRSKLLEAQAGAPLFRYDPATPELAAAVDELMEVYAQNPISVINLLTENALERIRNSTAAAFADAFHLRRDDGGKRRG